MEILIREKKGTDTLDVDIPVSGLNVKMPRVTFSAPHDITFETENADFIIRAQPDEMKQVMELLNKSWKRYSK